MNTHLLIIGALGAAGLLLAVSGAESALVFVLSKVFALGLLITAGALSDVWRDDLEGIEE
ncbi:MAG: hypothetical protein LUC22_01375 [Prevotella sp.]|nr:hypothetical protein [Prevotella sp.]